MVGHKGTGGLVPNTGHWPGNPGIGGFLCTGPIGRTVDDLVRVLRVIAGPDEGDPCTLQAPPLQDPDSVDLRTVTVFPVPGDGRLRVANPVRKGIARAAQALEAQGARVGTLDPRRLRKGFRITRVLPATEAEKAGLEPGDILLALDGQALDASELQDAQILQRRIEDMDIGAKATFKLLRDGKELDVAVVLEETPSTVADARSAEDDVLEYKVRELTYLDRVDKELPMDLEALMVADIEDGSWAAVAGLEVGDVLLELQGEPVPTIATFKDAVKRLHEARPERVRFFVRRGRDTTFVFARPDWPDAGE